LGVDSAAAAISLQFPTEIRNFKSFQISNDLKFQITLNRKFEIGLRILTLASDASSIPFERDVHQFAVALDLKNAWRA
jgi:hypothetical protein